MQEVIDVKMHIVQEWRCKAHRNTYSTRQKADTILVEVQIYLLVQNNQLSPNKAQMM